MLRRTMLGVVVITLAGAPAVAQQTPKIEVGVVIGWVFSDGVSGKEIPVPGVGTFNRIDPKNSFGWGFDVGVFMTENAEVGFTYTQQPTKLDASGTTTQDIGDLSTHTYHGIFTYNWGPRDARVRPYVFGGLGGTSYGDVSYVHANGTGGTISGGSRFSSTWGAGVKMYGASKIGGRVGLRWTPSYIKSDAVGWWCDAYWGCYLVGNAQYSNQVDINGGVTVRF